MTTSGTLTVIPSEGLANRLRIIATSKKLARKSNKKLVVFWNADKGLNANYGDLFEDNFSLDIHKPTFQYRVWLYLNSLSLRFKFLATTYLNLFGFDYVFFDAMARQVWSKEIDLQEKVNKSKNIFICSCQELGYFDIEDYQHFVPKTGLKRTIDTISEKFNSRTVGIHIRSTDNEWAKKNSPFSAFVKRMENEIKESEGVNFFLSTDNLEYQAELLKTFGTEKIIIQEKEFRRDSKKGIQDAVVDLFCLSRTSKIIGSYWSSFSEVAGRLGNIPVEILKVDVPG